jgi:hypothetical protein
MVPPLAPEYCWYPKRNKQLLGVAFVVGIPEKIILNPLQEFLS